MYESGEGCLAVVVFFEALDLLDVVDEVLDLLELAEGFGRYDVPQIFFQLHGQLDGVQRIKPMLG